MPTEDRQIFHRYRLIEEYKDDTYGLNGVNLSKTWVDFHSPKNEIHSYIRSKSNPSGIIDYVEYERISKTNLYDSDAYYRKVPTKIDPVVFYKMSRKELEEVCKMYGIVTTMKVNEFLIKVIIKAQDEFFVRKDKKDNVEMWFPK